MKLFSVALLLSVSISSFGQEILRGSVTKRIELDEVPSFFFKVNTDGSMIAYTVPSPGRRAIEPGQNQLIDTRTNQITLVPGPHDPVFIGDLDLLIIPTLTHSQYELFRVQDLLESNKAPFAAMKNLMGYYQSAGILERTPEFTTARVIAERSAKSHTVIDFKIDPSGGVHFDDSKTRILCPTTDFKLPMLSKDGRFVGGIDLSTNTSGVWRILENYECEKVYDLGIKAGKLNFNFDNSKLTYHIYKKIGESDVDTSDFYIPHPAATNVSDIFVYDVVTGKHEQITKNPSSNSLYPDFTDNGQLVFINHPHKDEKVSFVFLDL